MGELLILNGRTEWGDEEFSHPVTKNNYLDSPE